jgi:autotransporter-associated beta strand protein
MNDGTTLQFFSNTNAVSMVTRPVVVNGAVRIGSNSNNNNTFIGSNFLLNGNISVGINNSAASLLTLTGTISETGGPRTLTKTTLSVLNLVAANTYSGATTISGGTVNASILASGGLPSGIGQSGSAATNLVLSGAGTLGYTGTAPATTDRLFTIGAGGAGLNASGAAGAPVTFSSNGLIPNTAAAATTFTLGGTNADANTLAVKLQDGGGGAAAVLSVAKVGVGNWTLSGASTFSGTTAVNAGRLRVTGSIANSAGVTVNSGGAFEAGATQTVKALTINSGGTAVVSAGVLKIGDNVAPLPLTMSGGNLDLTTRGAIVDYAPGNEAANIQTIRGQVIAAYNNGDWLGNGITSSVIPATAGRAIGFAQASEALGASGGQFMGAAADPDAVLVRYTLAGDATLDGVVDFNDLVRLAQNYNTTVSSTTDSWWFNGDFTYDGLVDFNDLVKLAQNYNTALPSEPVPGAAAGFDGELARAFAAVPEPGSLAPFALSAAAWLGGRRRRRVSVADRID